MSIPRDRSFDGTLALLADPYRFIATRCRRYGCDAFVTRLMLRRAVCVVGEDASRMFYTPPQDLTLDMSHMPAVPRSRFRMREVRWRAPQAQRRTTRSYRFAEAKVRNR